MCPAAAQVVPNLKSVTLRNRRNGQGKSPDPTDSSTRIAQSGDFLVSFAVFRPWLPQRSKDYNPL